VAASSSDRFGRHSRACNSRQQPFTSDPDKSADIKVNTVKTIVLVAALTAAVLPASALAGTTKCYDLRRAVDSVGGKYDADSARIGQIYRSHGVPPGGGVYGLADKLSTDELASFANVLRDEIRNSRELVALGNSELENGCVVRTDKSMMRWFAGAADWLRTATPALKEYEASLAQKHGGASPIETATTSTPPAARPTVVTGRDSVPIYPGDHYGAALVDVSFGSHPVRMIIDTGATITSISARIAEAIVSEGEGEWASPTTFTLADGSTKTERVLRIHEARVGKHVVSNVLASVTDDESTMLLGFTLLNQIGPFMINTRTRELVFDS
jgi:clan AA aspartic protease (TIGR02281 family)